ncbi:MAG TPA: PilZ domain-containing protein [Phycisphaerales bacterium]|mgnify:CR=1 FL=1|nr:PilZ domain-containing protein [Phycisphaerales bacterium]
MTGAPVSTTHSDINDRRSHRRFSVERPGKMFHPASRQFVPAMSRDVSFAGALLEVETDRPFEAGEPIDVGLSLNNRAVVPASALLHGIVVRSEALGEHRQLVAVRYTHRDAFNTAA